MKISQNYNTEWNKNKHVQLIELILKRGLHIKVSLFDHNIEFHISPHLE